MGANRSVSDVLRSVIASGQEPERHNLSTYSKMLENFPLRVSEYLGAGADSIVLRLADGNILKITQRTEFPQSRSFDLPILDKGIVRAAQIAISWFVQPEAKSPVAESEFMPFLQRLRREGYRMTDPSLWNLCYFNGEIMLPDPWAVTKLPEQRTSE